MCVLAGMFAIVGLQRRSINVYVTVCPLLWTKDWSFGRASPFVLVFHGYSIWIVCLHATMVYIYIGLRCGLRSIVVNNDVYRIFTISTGFQCFSLSVFVSAIFFIHVVTWTMRLGGHYFFLHSISHYMDSDKLFCSDVINWFWKGYFFSILSAIAEKQCEWQIKENSKCINTFNSCRFR